MEPAHGPAGSADAEPAPAAASPGGAVPTSAVALTDVTARRGGRTIWAEGTFEIAPGSIVGVIGPNGSGKSTLLALLLGLLEPASGTVEVLGRSPRRGDPRIGYVPQDDDARTAEAIRCRDLVGLGLAGTRFGWGRRDASARSAVDDALAAVGATDYADRRLSQVSGGQRQRVAIAQAVVGRPELLLLDEPLAGLDVRNQHELATLLGEISAEQALTTMVVTHDINPLLGVLTGAVYLLDGHPHYAPIGDVVDETLLSHLYGTSVKVVRTPQGDLFTRSG